MIRKLHRYMIIMLCAETVFGKLLKKHTYIKDLKSMSILKKQIHNYSEELLLERVIFSRFGYNNNRVWDFEPLL